MGLLVVLLSVFNIALGYALAVYLRRASAHLSPLRPIEPRPEIVPAPKPQPIAKELPPEVKAAVVPAEVPDTVPEEITAETALETQPDTTDKQMAEAAETAIDPVDEENVLAGIEAFRAQLAQVKDEGEVEEPALT